MPRPPLPIGTWGTINKVTRGGLHVAYARFRDFDGVTRQVERTSTKSQGNAENLLREALRERATPNGDDINGETTLLVAGKKWWTDEIEGQKAYATERRYAETLAIVNQGLGGVRLREVTTARLDGFLRTIASTKGPATAKLSKTVLSGILGLAARMDAIRANPIRDVGTIKKPDHEVRALNLEQLQELRAIIAADEEQRHGDLQDPVDMLMGTGARIGEVLALRWIDLDLQSDPPTATVNGTTLWKEGEGMSIQNHPKSSTSRRKLVLPPFVAEMLRQRPLNSELVFASNNGNVRDPNNLRKQFRRAIAGTDFEWVTPHTFRKSVATLLVDVEDASAQLGHSGTEITKRHYREQTHAAPDLRLQLQRIGEPALTQRERPLATAKVAKPRRSKTA